MLLFCSAQPHRPYRRDEMLEVRLGEANVAAPAQAAAVDGLCVCALDPGSCGVARPERRGFLLLARALQRLEVLARLQPDDGPFPTARLLAKSDGRVGVTLGADAIPAALRRFGGIERIGLVTPYMPVGDEQAHRFFSDCGFEAIRVKGSRCGSPVLIAHTSEDALRNAIIEVDGPEVEAVVVVGTNLPMSRVAGAAEFWLGKPVVALNTATYWHALRKSGIQDKVQGFGRLFSEF